MKLLNERVEENTEVLVDGIEYLRTAITNPMHFKGSRVEWFGWLEKTGWQVLEEKILIKYLDNRYLLGEYKLMKKTEIVETLLLEEGNKYERVRDERNLVSWFRETKPNSVERIMRIQSFSNEGLSPVDELLLEATYQALVA